MIALVGAPTRALSQQDPRQIRALLDAGQIAAAEPAALALVAQEEREAGADSLGAGEALDLLVEALLRGGKAGEPASRAAAERAVAIKRARLGSSDPRTARSLHGLASLLFVTGRLTEARPVIEEALAIRQAGLGGDHADVAASLNQLATLEQSEGDFGAARRSYERALAIFERTPGAEHPDTAKVLNNFATLLKDSGDYARAGRLYQRSVEILEKAYGERHALVGTGLSNLAELEQRLGDGARARALYARALAIKEATVGPDHPGTAISLNNLALLEMKEGRLEAARPLLERALGIQERAAGPGHPSTALALNNLGELRLRTGDLAAARPLLERGLAIREAALGSAHADLAYSLQNLAELEAREGRLDESLRLATRGLAVRERALGEAHPLVAESLERLADLESHAATPEAAVTALAHALRAEEIARGHLRSTARFLPESQALLFAAERASGLSLVLRLAARGDAAAVEPAWDSLVRSRAVVLDEIAERRRSLVDGSDAFNTTLADVWRAAAARYTSLVLRGPGSLPASRFQELVGAAAGEKESAERDLAARSARLRRLIETEDLGWSAVRAALEKSLPSGSALVSFARYEVGMRPGRLLPRGGAYLAFVAAPGAAPVAVALGDAQAIDDLVGRWRAEIVRGGSVAGAGAALRNAIWDPLAAGLGGARRVFVVPDGSLHLVSFAALPNGRGRFLVEDLEGIHYLSAERELVAARAGAGRPGSGLLAIGAPDFDAAPPDTTARLRGQTSTCDSFRQRRFDALPGAESEIAEVARLWPSDRSDGGEDSVLRLTGARASEDAFKQAASGRRGLHVATHGFFLGGSCPDGLENPLLRSGIVLSGANRRSTEAGGDDGVLTAEEIAALDLDGMDWAVVSGCETGVGEIRAGEGILGLRRAFAVAGARTLISSLWPVEDQAARRWMRELYTARFTRGRSTIDAVRLAQLAVLESERRAGRPAHPAAWAGFVAAGDWR